MVEGLGSIREPDALKMSIVQKNVIKPLNDQQRAGKVAKLLKSASNARTSFVSRYADLKDWFEGKGNAARQFFVDHPKTAVFVGVVGVGGLFAVGTAAAVGLSVGALFVPPAAGVGVFIAANVGALVLGIVVAGVIQLPSIPFFVPLEEGLRTFLFGGDSVMGMSVKDRMELSKSVLEYAEKHPEDISKGVTWSDEFRDMVKTFSETEDQIKKRVADQRVPEEGTKLEKWVGKVERRAKEKEIRSEGYKHQIFPRALASSDGSYRKATAMSAERFRKERMVQRANARIARAFVPV